MEPGFYNCDCVEAMKQFPDGFFDLAIVDPPYGDGGQNIGGGARFGQRFDRYKQPLPTEEPQKTKRRGGAVRTGGQTDKKYGKKIIEWDVAPGPEYFAELFRVSQHQIIWGGNYFDLPPSRNFIIWRKLTISENFSMAMAEYAWTNIIGNAKVFECTPQGKGGERFHPTQKPVALYSWLLKHYAKGGDKILDTHVGSASSLIACHRAGLQYWGFEIDPAYYKAAKKRLDAETAQVNLADIINGGGQVNLTDAINGGGW